VGPGRVLEENLHDALGSMAIPEGRNAARLALSGKNGLSGGDDFCWIRSDEEVRAFGNRDGALGVFAKGEAGDAESGGFFLNAAGIRQNERGFAEEAEKIEIADGRDELELSMSLDAGLQQALLGTRMDRENDRDLGGDGVNGAKEFGKFFGGVDVRRAMQSENAKAAPISSLLQGQVIADGGFLGDGKKMAEGIDHDVSDEIDRFAGTAFLEQMLDGVFFGDEEVVGQSIGENAINFLGHGAIKAAEAGFDMCHGNAEFYGGERNGDGGVDVADDENEIGLAFEQDGLDALKDFSGLGGMGARADFKIDVRSGNPHLAKENVRESFVVVLAGVNEDGIDFGMALHFANERRNLGKIGTCAYDVDNFQLHVRQLLGFEPVIDNSTAPSSILTDGSEWNFRKTNRATFRRAG